MKTFLVYVLLISIAMSGEQKRSLEMSTAQKMFENLDWMTGPEQGASLTTLEHEWQTRKGTLIRALLRSENQKARFCAAYLLGLYRYPEAVNDLAAKITMENDDEVLPQGKEARWDRYPAVEALIRIGKPSVPAMLRNIASSSDQHVRALSGRVIFYVEGEQIGRLIVESASAKEDDPVKKKNLETSLPLIKGGEYK